MQQTEPMEIDEGVEHHCYRCHLIYYGTELEHDPECRQHGYCMTHQRLERPRYGYSKCGVATRIPIPGPISTLGKRLMYRLPHNTSIGPRYGDWRSHAIEGDTDSKGTAPDEGDTDRKDPAPDGGDAECYMIHLPTALETQLRAPVVNRRHLNNRF